MANQLHNKKVFNKIKSKAANEVFVIKAIKGSMITIFSGDREFTRNVFLLKKLPMEWKTILNYQFFSCSNSNNSNQINDSNSNQNNHKIIEIDT